MEQRHQEFLNHLIPHKVRTMSEWVQQEIVLPTGPYAGEKFKFSVSPWTELLFSAMDDTYWREIVGMGSVQSGKSLCIFAAPILYHLFEMEESVLCGVPTMDMANGIYFERLLPIINQTRYRDLLPTEGAGSRKGKITAITFKNGTTLRFLGAGGSDATRSSYSSRVLVITEADKFDEIKGSSDETDPIGQMKARTTAYGDQARIYIECTVSHENGFVYQEAMIKGSGSSLLIKCPHCNEYITPERKYLVGHSDAENIIQARSNAGYACNLCGCIWTEEDRRSALNNPKIEHQRGKDKTNIFGITWNAMHSGLLTMGDIVEKEFEAQQSDSEASNRYVHQFVWSLPHKESDIQQSEVTIEGLISHIDKKYKLKEKPDIIDTIISSIDVQKSWLYHSTYGYAEDGSAYLIDFGVIDIVPIEVQTTVNATPEMVITALEEAYDYLNEFAPNAIMLDASYKHESSTQDLVKNWSKSHPSVHAFVGRGTQQMDKLNGKRLSTKASLADLIQIRKQNGGAILYFVDVDRIKDEAYSRLLRARGDAGYVYLPADILNKENKWWFRHMTGERPKQVKRGGRAVRVWIATRSRHDEWDCFYMCLSGYLINRAGGFKSLSTFNIKKKEEIKESPTEGTKEKTTESVTKLKELRPISVPKKRVASYCQF